MDFLLLLPVLLFSVVVHEYAHGWVALRQGDPTAYQLGRLTLNPIPHIDPIGSILLPLAAFLSGIPFLGWAKPVPVNTRALGPHWRQKFMVVAAAGPASNLVLAIIAAILVRFTPAGALSGALESAVYVNVLLALFNMVPVPPLDGGNVLSGLLTGSMADTFDRLRPYGFLILYAMMLTGVLTAIILPPEALLLSWLL